MMDEDPVHRIAVLQAQVTQRLADLRRLRPGDDDYDEATDSVLAAATELIAYEKRLPVLLDTDPHRVSVLVVRWSGVTIGAVGVSLGIAAVVGWLPRWWLLGVAAVLAVGVGFLRGPIPGPTSGHIVLRPGATAAALGAVLVAVGAVGAISAGAELELWLVGAGAVLMIGGFLHVRRVAAGPSTAPVLLHAMRPR
jgi:hypothetical protein